jgi:hypothetical protein
MEAVAQLAGEIVLVNRAGGFRRGLPQGSRPCVSCSTTSPFSSKRPTPAAAARGSLAIVHAVPLPFGERSIGLRSALEHGQGLLGTAADRLATEVPGLRVVPQLLRAHAHELVADGLEPICSSSADPAAPAPQRLGLVVRTALQHAACPILLVPRNITPDRKGVHG